MATRMGDFTEILIQRGVISADQLNEAEQMAREQDMNVGDCLIRLGYATGDEVARAMAEHHGLKFIDLSASKIPEEVIEQVPESVATAEEIHLIWRWMNRPGVNIIQSTGPLSLPIHPVPTLE